MKRVLGILFGLIALFQLSVNAQKQVEALDRSVVAIRTGTGTVFVQWRLQGTEPENIAFNVYRGSTLVNATPITGATNLTDNVATNENYTVKAVVNGVEGTASKTASVLTASYFDITITPPAGGTDIAGTAYTYNANDCSVGDLDGDGEYEIVLKWDPSNSHDNSEKLPTSNCIIDAYKLNGTRLWRIDLGINIRSGAHYTQFMVYDLDGDGKAEMVCKTSDGSKDAAGTVIGDGTKDYRNNTTQGLVLTGNEYLTVFNGQTGVVMKTINYEPARGNVNDWGDNYGNRSDRFLACVAYLDGIHPSVVMCRGYYTRAVLVAYDWDGTDLTKRWTFDSSASGNSAYAGQGNHNLSVADVDFDGKDEIVYGACAIDDDGKGLYSTGLRHGDALHVSDMDPTRPGLEVWQCHEESAGYATAGGEFRDARTGAMIFGVPATADVGRAMAADITTAYPGYEMWSTANSDNKLFTCKGTNFATKSLSKNFGVWWDGDRMRELLDNITITKYNGSANSVSTLLTATDCSSNNSTKATPCLSADILGDWREEVILRKTDNTALRVFITTTPTDTRLYTLMHDPQYRCAIAWQNVAYNQPPHTSFYLADGYPIPKQNIYEVGATTTTYNLNLTVNGQGNVYASPVGVKYVAGTEVTLTSVSKINNTFTNWTGDVNSTNSSITITMDGNKTIAANFTNNATAFTVSTSVSMGSGTVALTPTGGTYQINTTVTVTASPTSGYKFDSWSGDLSGTTNPSTLTMTVDKTISASFARINPTGVFVEAETGTFTGTTDNNYVGYTGTGFVNTENVSGTVLSIPITVGQTGSYKIVVYYANASSARGMTIGVNGTTVGSLTGAVTGAWTTWVGESLNMNLNQGNGTLTLTATTSGGLANIDKIELVYLGESTIKEKKADENIFFFFQQDKELFVEATIQNATEADVLITDISGRKVFSGNYDFTVGKNVYNLFVKGLSGGLYLCNVIYPDGTSQTSKLILK